jgi:hypothetical protein
VGQSIFLPVDDAFRMAKASLPGLTTVGLDIRRSPTFRFTSRTKYLYSAAVADELIYSTMNARTDTPRPCPTCQGQNTTKCVDSLLTEIHICRDCHETFTIQKPQERGPSSATSASA